MFKQQIGHQIEVILQRSLLCPGLFYNSLDLCGLVRECLVTLIFLRRLPEELHGGEKARKKGQRQRDEHEIEPVPNRLPTQAPAYPPVVLLGGGFQGFQPDLVLRSIEQSPRTTFFSPYHNQPPMNPR